MGRIIGRPIARNPYHRISHGMTYGASHGTCWPYYRICRPSHEISIEGVSNIGMCQGTAHWSSPWSYQSEHTFHWKCHVYAVPRNHPMGLPICRTMRRRVGCSRTVGRTMGTVSGHRYSSMRNALWVVHLDFLWDKMLHYGNG